jgi:hypothetical protein
MLLLPELLLEAAGYMIPRERFLALMLSKQE